MIIRSNTDLKVGYRAEWKIHCLEGAFFTQRRRVIGPAPLLDNEEKLPVSFTLKPHCYDFSSVIQMKAYTGTNLKPGTIRICIHLGVGVKANTWR